MLKLTTRPPDTRKLVRAEHRLLTARPGRPWLWSIAALLCLVAALFYLRIEEDASHAQQLAALVAQNHALDDALEQARLQRREAEATHEQLLGRIALLSTQIERLQTDLAFFRQQKNAR